MGRGREGEEKEGQSKEEEGGGVGRQSEARQYKKRCQPRGTGGNARGNELSLGDEQFYLIT